MENRWKPSPDKPPCGLSDYCEQAYSHRGNDKEALKAECRICLLSANRPFPDHIPHILTLVYISLINRAHILSGMIQRWYDSEALDDLDIEYLGITARMLGV